MDLARYRAALRAWLDADADTVADTDADADTVADTGAAPTAADDLDRRVARTRRILGRLWAADLGRWGWPERAGGLGGSPLLRAELGATLVARDLADPGVLAMIEVLAPTVIEAAPADRVAEWVPRLCSGAEVWCQGFSEPATGSDLAALTCRATPVGGDPATASAFVVRGQKVWTSLAQYADRCVLLARTGPPEARHRAITAFLVDMDDPGITVAPIEMVNGAREFAEVFFDDVVVPADRILGARDGGWDLAMRILPYERSTCFWHRIAYLEQRCTRLAAGAPADDRAALALGEAVGAVHTLRARSRATLHRLAAGETLGPETSVDKLLVAAAELATFDAARALLPGTVELADDPVAAAWRREYLYSRAVTVYGGAAEIQRNIVARRLLDLGPER